MDSLLSDKKIITVKGITFTINLIPVLVWHPLKYQFDAVNRHLVKALREVSEDQLKDMDNDALYGIATKNMTPEEIDGLEKHSFNAAYEILRVGIAGHEGLTGKDGQPVPFELDADGRASKRVIDFYYRKKIFNALVKEVVAFQELTEEQEKN